MANDSVEQTFAALVEFIANKFLRGEVNVADLIGLDDQEIETIFLMGHYLYNYGKYEAALNVFSLLTLYKPFVSRFWRAAGAANQALKKYVEAVAAYDMALTTNTSDVIRRHAYQRNVLLRGSSSDVPQIHGGLPPSGRHELIEPMPNGVSTTCAPFVVP